MLRGIELRVVALILALAIVGFSALRCGDLSDNDGRVLESSTSTPNDASGFFDDAEQQLGWIPLRAGDEYKFEMEDAVVETFNGVGEPRLRIRYVSMASEEAVSFLQGPRAYLPELEGPSVRVQAGSFDMDVFTTGGSSVGIFETGQASTSGPIFGVVIAVTSDEIVRFVESLSRPPS
jgi:hypothetical protein